VPPSRALWIPPNVEHVVTTLEDAEIRTLYIHPDAAARPEWRVLEVSSLLRELVLNLDTEPGTQPTTLREQCITALIEGWARHAGASPRTVARLFRSELGTSFGQWRQQALLAHALSLAARKLPMASIAAELGYSSPSAFTAMVKRTLGAPPTHFFT
jgi:AraC-like DNA-binding protein